MYRSARRVADELDVTAPIICYQGALVRSPETETDIWHQALEGDIALSLVAHLEEQGFTALAFRDDQVHALRDNDHTRAYTRLSNTEAQLIGAWEEFFARGPVTKLVAVSTPERVVETVSPLRETHQGVAHVVQSQPDFLEIVHPLANKGIALSKVCQLLGFQLQRSVAVGDGQNDIEMIQAAGLGVAMAQGHPDLLSVADRVTQSLANDGLADLVESLLRPSEQVMA